VIELQKTWGAKHWRRDGRGAEGAEGDGVLGSGCPPPQWGGVHAPSAKNVLISELKWWDMVHSGCYFRGEIGGVVGPSAVSKRNYTRLAQSCPMWQWLEVRGPGSPLSTPRFSKSKGAVKTSEGARHTLADM